MPVVNFSFLHENILNNFFSAMGFQKVNKCFNKIGIEHALYSRLFAKLKLQWKLNN